MSLEHQPAHLPKRTKVRSTCNACQQAKIRCSHEKPSCRRCQKHNIDCIYSISRRLGRPAKRKDGVAAADQGGEKEKLCRVQRRDKTGKTKVEESQNHSLSLKTETKDVSIDDGLGTPLFGEGSSSLSDNIDFASDSWLQDFVYAQSSDVQDRSLFGSLDMSVSSGFKDPTIFLPLSTASITQDLNSSGYFGDTALPPNPDAPVDYLTTPSITAPKPACLGYPKRDSLVDSLPGSSMSTDQGHYSFPEETPLSFSLETPPLEAQNPCQCYKQAIRELIRVSNFSPHMAQSSIDTILICQRALQQLADTVLQCGTCSQNRVNLLMVVVISIDSLLATLEATGPAAEAGFDSLSDDIELGNDIPIGHASRYSGTASTVFKAQAESCPLLVGRFRIPSDDKYCFIKQLLHRRLSRLLGTIRRIRGCTQQILASSCSRGRLIMMMETDRRLQLIMMKFEMFSR